MFLVECAPQSSFEVCAINCKTEDEMGMVLSFLTGVVATWLFVHWITENGWYEIVEPKKEGRAE